MFKVSFNKYYLAIPLLLWSSLSQAITLKEILRNSFVYDPEVREASANIDAARMRTESAEYQHWPIVSLTGNQILAQHHDSRSDYSSESLVPGVTGEVNLYSFGAISAEIDRNRKEEIYYEHQYNATREEVGYTIADLYLRAYTAKESIKAMEKSLQRHHAFMKDMDVILEFDEGRESEYVQAEARLLTVEQEINRYRRELVETLNTLSKYTKKNISEKDLVDPFKGVNPNTLLAQYTVDKEDSPAYKAQQAELEVARLERELEQKKRMPKLNLSGTATTEDRYVGLSMSWDIFNPAAGSTVREKAARAAAANERLDRVGRDIEDTARVAKDNVAQYQVQLKTLKSQAHASAKVVDFYRLQFEIARRTLLDVLNAERELTTIELSQVTTQYALNAALLNFLRSQGTLGEWAGVKKEERVKVNLN